LTARAGADREWDVIFDLTITGATLRERPKGRWHLGMRDGLIAAISPAPLDGSASVDAAGGLVTTPFASAHMHLCKVHTLSMLGEEALRRYSEQGMGDTIGAIRLAAAVKDRYDAEWIVPNVRAAIKQAVANGTTAMRAFADVDTRARLEGVRSVMQVRDEYSDLIDVQVVAFPQDGLLCDLGAEDLVRQALEEGADLVGGIPWIEHTDADAREHVRRCFDLAVEFDRDVAMLVDDASDPHLRTTEMLAAEAIARGWQGRVTACHARALGTYPEPSLRRLMALAERADMAFVSNPHTGPLHLPIFTLLDSGLTVALGQDDIEDAYYPYGQGNLLEVAFLASHVLHRFTLDDAAAFLDMVTVHARRAIGLPDAAITEGEPADLVVLDGATPREVLALHRPPRAVVRRGRVVATTEVVTNFNLQTP
jgi:cytosine deaminase